MTSALMSSEQPLSFRRPDRGGSELNLRMCGEVSANLAATVRGRPPTVGCALADKSRLPRLQRLHAFPSPAIHPRARRAPAQPCRPRHRSQARRVSDGQRRRGSWPLPAAPISRERAAQILRDNGAEASNRNINDYFKFLKEYNDARARLDESLFEGFEEYTVIDVNIGYLRGSRDADFAAADALAGITRAQRSGLTWHHHPHLGRMVLVPQSVHAALSHWGGVSIWQVFTGQKYP